MNVRIITHGQDIVVELCFGAPNDDGKTRVKVILEKLVGWPEIAIPHDIFDVGIERAKANRHGAT